MSTMEESSVIDLLCTVELPEEKHEIVRNGQTIELTIRALTHDEALQLQEYGKKDDVSNAQYEQKMLGWALLWPKMNAGQIKAWQKSSKASELAKIVEAVTKLSGMGEDEQKNAYKSDADEPEFGE